MLPPLRKSPSSFSWGLTDVARPKIPQIPKRGMHPITIKGLSVVFTGNVPIYISMLFLLVCTKGFLCLEHMAFVVVNLIKKHKILALVMVLL